MPTCPKLCLLSLSIALVGVAMSTHSFAAEKSPVLSHTMNSLDGQPVDLAKYKGKVLLIVNVASRCGATPQYKQLQELHEKYQDKGLVVLGFPCNQFGAQEPGTAQEIASFCKDNYKVTFPMFSKIDVNGDNAAPLYQHLTSEEAVPADPGAVRWNFEKFLIGRDGQVIQRFRTRVSPDASEVVQAIEKALAAKS